MSGGITSLQLHTLVQKFKFAYCDFLSELGFAYDASHREAYDKARETMIQCQEELEGTILVKIEEAYNNGYRDATNTGA